MSTLLALFAGYVAGTLFCLMAVLFGSWVADNERHVCAMIASHDPAVPDHSEQAENRNDAGQPATTA